MDSPGPSSAKHPRLDDQIESQTTTTLMRPGIDRINLDWETNKFLPDIRVINGKSYTCYKSSVKQYKGLEWYIIWMPRIPRPSSTGRLDAKTAKKWKLKVKNTTARDLNAYIWLEFTILINIHFNSGIEDTQWSTSTGIVSMLNCPSGEQKTVFSWEGKGIDETLGKKQKVFHIGFLIEFLHKCDGENGAKFTKEAKEIISAMEEEQKVVQEVQKWLNLNESNYNFWIESSTGSKIGFHKQILEFRGGVVVKAMLSSGMVEPQNDLTKMENVNEEIIRGFKSYLYGEKVPNFEKNAMEYFKFANQYQLKQLKDLAELEICKMLHSKNLKEAHEIAKYFPTEYLKEEIITLLSESYEDVIRNNFDMLENL